MLLLCISLTGMKEEDGMKVDFLKNGTTLTVKPDGRLDTATSPELERLMQPEMEGMTDIIIDMEKVDYISSRGLRILLTVEQDMEDRGGSVKVIHVNPIIMEVFEMTGFLDLLTVE